MKEYNVLILDDIKLAGESIENIICKLNTSYSLLSGIKIIPHYKTIDISDIKTAAENITLLIYDKEIDYLLLDRGFSYVIDNLDNEFLYAENKGKVQIEDILKLIPIKCYNRIKGTIIYTYDQTPKYTETIQKEFLASLPNKFDKKKIEFYRSNIVYEEAGLKLYADPEPAQPNYFKLGLKANFKLYGLLIGEILYHKLISMINQREKAKFIAKKEYGIRYVFVLFFVFTGLTLGGNALYNMLAKNGDDYLLLILSIVFSVLIPLFILWIKPELIIPKDNENNQKD
jgi:hypothetical protein